MALDVISMVHGSITGYITSSDKKKFIHLLSPGTKLEVDDLSTPYYFAKGYKLLNEPYDKNYVQQTCTHLRKNYNPSVGLENSFNAFSSWNLLGCEGKLQSDNTIKASNKISR